MIDPIRSRSSRCFVQADRGDMQNLYTIEESWPSHARVEERNTDQDKLTDQEHSYLATLSRSTRTWRINPPEDV